MVEQYSLGDRGGESDFGLFMKLTVNEFFILV